MKNTDRYLLWNYGKGTGEMTLESSLREAKQAFGKKLPADVQNEIVGLIREQSQSGIAYGLQPGDAAEDAALPNAAGETVRLAEQWARGPVVLVFYRGGWCPFCNLQLRAYQAVLPDIEALGARLIAISPQSPDHASTQQEKEALRFDVLSDQGGVAAARYRLLFELPPSLSETMANKMNLDLTAYNATDRWILPVPATFIIDRTGVVRYAYANPDFMRRLEPGVVLEQLRKL